MKKNVAKWIAVLCMLAMVVSLFTACGGKTNENAATKTVTEQTAESSESTSIEQEPTKKEFANKELEVAVFEGGYGKAYWEEVIKNFETDYPGVKVTLNSNPKIKDIITPRIVAGNPPDVYFMAINSSSGIPQLAAEGQLLDITGIFDEKSLDKDTLLKDNIQEGFLDSCMPLGDGKVYYAPMSYSVGGLWYNKALFDSKGWKAPYTWDEFFAFADKAKELGRALFTYQGIYPSYNESLMMTSIANIAGVNAVKDILNYKEGAWNTDAVKKVLGAYLTIGQKDYLMKGTVAMNHTQAQTEFMQGKALFCPNGDWFEGEMKDAPREAGFTFGFIPTLAQKDGDQRYLATYINGVMAFSKAKNPELAKEFIKYQFTDASVMLDAQKSKSIRPVKGVIEKVKSELSDSVYNCYKVFDEGVKPLMIDWKPALNTEVEMYKVIYDPINVIMNKQDMTVEKWIDSIEKAAAKIRAAETK